MSLHYLQLVNGQILATGGEMPGHQLNDSVIISHEFVQDMSCDKSVGGGGVQSRIYNYVDNMTAV